MGFRALQWWRQHRPRGLKTPQICIMWEACYSCEDDTALLAFEAAWLTEKCRLSSRSLDRHLPRLGTLQLLVRGEMGFRLPLFFKHDRQFGGSRQTESAILSANLAEERKEPKERSIGKEDMERPPVVPLKVQTRKRDRRERNRDRLTQLDRPELQPFTLCWCELCPLPHYWKIQESGYVGEVQDAACLEWREKVREIEVRR